MIPTMVLFGLVLGRWWRLALVASAVVWPLIVVVAGDVDTPGEVVGSALLGVANAVVGVAVHQAVLLAVRRWG